MNTRRATTAGILATTALALTACSDNADATEPADETVPVVTMPFGEPSTRLGSDNTLEAACTDGGKYEITSSSTGIRVVTPDASYQVNALSDGETTIPIPESETSVVQIIPSGGECTVRGQQGPAASLGEYTITERTVFAISQ